MFFRKILKLINRNEINSPIKTTIEYLDLFTRCILVCCYYGHAPSKMWEDKAGFPHFTLAIKNLGGIDKFIYMIGCLKSHKVQNDLSWDNYFDECHLISELEKFMEKNCSEIINHHSIRNVTIDDDKLRFRSNNWETLGYTRRKGIKPFGPVNTLTDRIIYWGMFVKI